MAIYIDDDHKNDGDDNNKCNDDENDNDLRVRNTTAQKAI